MLIVLKFIAKNTHSTLSRLAIWQEIEKMALLIFNSGETVDEKLKFLLFYVVPHLRINSIRVVGADNNIIAIKMLYNAGFLEHHHPASILVHTVIYNK
ncbi:hypothetical protein [Chitinophaga costaii]|uniref:hypothetical protein n=1 Tax=Chitinophaga costaii TaxID=1335309 RepID=UPI0013FD9593|nr:hypothetical protein [Chitinophaga costaii]